MNIIKKVLFILIILLLFFSLPAIASENAVVEFYNHGKKVELSHNPVYYNNDLFLCVDELEAFGLAVEEGTEDDDYILKISSSDFYGVTAMLTLLKSENSLISYPITISATSYEYDIPVIELPEQIINILTKKSIYKRSEYEIGESFMSGDVLFPGYDYSSGYLIEYKGKKYISSKLIASSFSYGYSVTDERVDLYLPSEDTVIIESEIYINEGIIIPEGGIRAEIKIAEKNGDESKILTETVMYIDKAKTAYICMSEISSAMISGAPLYYMVDLGERYEKICVACDFSQVRKVVLYASHTYLESYAEVYLTEPEAEDVNFTFSVRVNKEKYLCEGVIKKGELSANVKITNLPLAVITDRCIDFEAMKYRDYTEEKSSISWVGDRQITYTVAKYNEIKCIAALPEGYRCEEEIKVYFSIYRKNSFSLDTEDVFNYVYEINLNETERRKSFIIYTPDEEVYIKYKTSGLVSGLIQTGYLKSPTEVTNNLDEAGAISCEESVEIILHERMKCPVEITYDTTSDSFIITNISSYTVYDPWVMIAYYDENGLCLTVVKTNLQKISPGTGMKQACNREIAEISKIKAYIWEKDTLIPLALPCEDKTDN